MSKTIELYVHTANGVDPKLVKTSEDATVKQLIEAIVSSGGVHLPDDGGELRLSIEDYDEHLDLNRKLCECEIRHRHHVHCHSCHKVNVSVFYNAEKSATFAPSVKVKQVLKWAIKEFKLSPTDAADKILVLKDDAQVELDLDAHIGSYANPRSCSINLCLTAPVEVQG